MMECCTVSRSQHPLCNTINWVSYMRIIIHQFGITVDEELMYTTYSSDVVSEFISASKTGQLASVIAYLLLLA